MSPEETYEVRTQREFPVGVDELYAAWTEPAAIRQWWGPAGFSCPVAELDVREGGVSLLAMRAPAEYGGGDTYNTWTYSLVEPPTRLEYVMRFATSSGQTISPEEAGVPGGVPDAVPHEVTFEGLDGQRSRVTVTEYGYADQGARDLSQAGLEQCLDKLALLLTGRSAAAGSRS